MPRRDNEKAESQGHLPSSRTVVHNEEEEREREGVGRGGVKQDSELVFLVVSSCIRHSDVSSWQETFV